jgi:hypothetical protein
MSDIKIEDLLIVYPFPNTKRSDPYSNFYSDLLPKNIKYIANATNFLKKEFYQERSFATDPPRIPGKISPLPRQKFISRFAGIHTPNRRILNIWGLGTGKSCANSLIVELSATQDPNRKPAIYAVKNENLKKSLINEISNVCASGKYIPSLRDEKTGENISSTAWVRRLNRNIEDRYEIVTLERLAADIAEFSDKELINYYSDRDIIIDEAHHVRPQHRTEKDEKENKLDLYKQIWRLTHIPYNTTIVLSTATPMVDRPWEIAALLNLLLPINKQFNLSTFQAEYFEKGKFGKFKIEKRDEFKSKIRGLVSYVRSATADAQRIQEGILVEGVNSPLAVVHMSEHQSKYYSLAYTKDKRTKTSVEDIDENLDDEEKGSLWWSTRQASLFVAPDGSIDEELISKGWVKPPPDSKKSKPGEKKLRLPLKDRLYHLTDKMKNFLTGTTEEKLEKLSIYSVEYAGCIRELINNPTEKAFIYIDIVAGGGLWFLAALLQYFGFSHVQMPSSEDTINIDIQKYRKQNQFLIITSKFPQAREVQILRDQVYNSSENLYGDYIRIIIASKTIGEGASFKETRQFHDLTPGWNETETSQAKGRVLRAFAFDNFPINERIIKLWFWCAIPSNDTESINLKMYILSQNKDYPIKEVERLLKESAVDCGLNVARNQPVDQYGKQLEVDGSSSCDYSTCLYSCDGIPEEWYREEKIPGLINDSYNVLYADDDVADIKSKLVKLFIEKFYMEFTNLVNYFPGTTPIVLLRTLKNIIDDNLIIYNRYGTICYLRENNDLYFLVDNQELRSKDKLWLSTYYAEHPFITERMKFDEWLTYYENKYLINKINDLETTAKDISGESKEEVKKALNKADWEDRLKNSLHTLNINQQENIVEAMIEARSLNLNKNLFLRESILEVYNNNLVNLLSGTIVSDVIKDKRGLINHRCFVPKKGWKNCDSKQIAAYNKIKSRKKQELNSVYGYIGHIDHDDEDKFKIKVILPIKVAASTGEPDKREQNRAGTTCGNGYVSTAGVKGLLILFGDIAEGLGKLPPDLRPKLNAKQLNEIEKYANPDSVWNLFVKNAIKAKDAKELKGDKLEWLPRSEKNRGRFPQWKREEIDEFSDDKIERVYAILQYGSQKNVCEVLKSFFEREGALLV